MVFKASINIINSAPTKTSVWPFVDGYRKAEDDLGHNVALLHLLYLKVKYISVDAAMISLSYP